MAGFYSARRRTIPTLPWPTFAPPLSRYAKTNVERLICADGSLSQLDSEMNRLFKEIEGETWGRDGETGEPIDPAGDEQRQWRETVRDACVNTACLRAAYTDRLAAMRKKWADALRPADQ